MRVVVAQHQMVMNADMRRMDIQQGAKGKSEFFILQYLINYSDWFSSRLVMLLHCRLKRNSQSCEEVVVSLDGDCRYSSWREGSLSPSGTVLYRIGC